MSKVEARNQLIDELDIAASITIEQHPELDKLAVYNTLQYMAWKVAEGQPCLATECLARSK